MLTVRKHRISRLEELGDAVFGFALTLLVITSAVPRSHGELKLLLYGKHVEKRRVAFEASLTAVEERQVT